MLALARLLAMLSMFNCCAVIPLAALYRARITVVLATRFWNTSRRFVDADEFALAGPPVLDLHLAVAEALGSDDDLIGQADQVERREFGDRTLVAIVVEHVHARPGQRGVDARAGGVGCAVADFQIGEADREGRPRVGPDDAGFLRGQPRSAPPPDGSGRCRNCPYAPHAPCRRGR